MIIISVMCTTSEREMKRTYRFSLSEEKKSSCQILFLLSRLFLFIGKKTFFSSFCQLLIILERKEIVELK